MEKIENYELIFKPSKINLNREASTFERISIGFHSNDEVIRPLSRLALIVYDSSVQELNGNVYVWQDLY